MILDMTLFHVWLKGIFDCQFCQENERVPMFAGSEDGSRESHTLAVLAARAIIVRAFSD
jgi:hypothetical protein